MLGLGYALVIWLPLPLVLVHLATSQHTDWRQHYSLNATVLLLLASLVFWPIVPTLAYVSLLFSSSHRAKQREWRVGDNIVISVIDWFHRLMR